MAALEDAAVFNGGIVGGGTAAAAWLVLVVPKLVARDRNEKDF